MTILLNQLSKVDILFLVVCVAIVAVIVAVYFLIPVFNKKQYAEQRENLRIREEAFNRNLKSKDTPIIEELKDENE